MATERNELIIAEFREHGGRAPSFGDDPLLLLTTVGARSGQPRTTPMMYLADDRDPDRVYVFASAAGSHKHPGWYYNVLARPTALTVEIGERTVRADAAILDEPERTRVYETQTSRYPRFGEYQRSTARVIPVIALDLRP